MKYPLPEPGEWVQPIYRGYKMGCCDCGLVHKINFRLAGPQKKIQMQFFRDERATGAVRRWMKSG